MKDSTPEEILARQERAISLARTKVERNILVGAHASAPRPLYDAAKHTTEQLEKPMALELNPTSPPKSPLSSLKATQTTSEHLKLTPLSKMEWHIFEFLKKSYDRHGKEPLLETYWQKVAELRNFDMMDNAHSPIWHELNGLRAYLSFLFRSEGLAGPRAVYVSRGEFCKLQGVPLNNEWLAELFGVPVLACPFRESASVYLMLPENIEKARTITGMLHSASILFEITTQDLVIRKA